MNEYGFSGITSKLLIARKKTEKWQIDSFLNDNLNDLHNPADIPGIDDVKRRIMEHIKWGSFICNFSDFDVDGVTSAAILSKALDKLKANYFVLVSDRFRDGYSLSKKAIDIMDENGVGLCITSDCGISSIEEIEYANSLGIEVIVLDHHLNENPPDTLFLDLKVNKGDYPFDLLSGAGIVWKLCQHLLNDNFYEVLDLVALSSIADVVPLFNENRIIVKEGLKHIENTKNIGLQELLKISGVYKGITTGDIGYKTAPLINAQGRLGNNQISYELLTTNDQTRAKEIVLKLKEVNDKRKEITNETFNKIKDKVDDSKNIIVEMVDIPKGITGLVAGRVQEHFKKPALIFNKGLSGSMRSYKPLTTDIVLSEINHLLESGGGHMCVLGASLKPGKFNEVQKTLYKLAEGLEYETIKYDLEVSPGQITIDLINELEQLQPYGMGFPRPKFITKVNDISNLTLLKKEHIKFNIGDKECIGFFMPNKYDVIKDKPFSMVYSPGVNSWRGKNTVQLMIKDI